MEKDPTLRGSPKKPPTGQAVVVALLALQGIVLIVIGLIAFFGGFVGAYQVSNGHATPGAIVAVVVVFLAWIFLLGRIVSFLCALGLSTCGLRLVWLSSVNSPMRLQMDYHYCN
jgi:hypothetical protein